jgi:hypothetical protein
LSLAQLAALLVAVAALTRLLPAQRDTTITSQVIDQRPVTS